MQRGIFLFSCYQWLASIVITSICFLACFPQFGVCDESREFEASALVSEILGYSDAGDMNWLVEGVDK